MFPSYSGIILRVRVPLFASEVPARPRPTRTRRRPRRARGPRPRAASTCSDTKYEGGEQTSLTQSDNNKKNWRDETGGEDNFCLHRPGDEGRDGHAVGQRRAREVRAAGHRGAAGEEREPWLRTNGVDTNGAAARGMKFDRLRNEVRPGTFGKIKVG